MKVTWYYGSPVVLDTWVHNTILPPQDHCPPQGASKMSWGSFQRQFTHAFEIFTVAVRILRLYSKQLDNST